MDVDPAQGVDVLGEGLLRARGDFVPGLDTERAIDADGPCTSSTCFTPGELSSSRFTCFSSSLLGTASINSTEASCRIPIPVRRISMATSAPASGSTHGMPRWPRKIPTPAAEADSMSLRWSDAIARTRAFPVWRPAVRVNEVSQILRATVSRATHRA
jgi:hypothetical protein